MFIGSEIRTWTSFGGALFSLPHSACVLIVQLDLPSSGGRGASVTFLGKPVGIVSKPGVWQVVKGREVVHHECQFKGSVCQ